MMLNPCSPCCKTCCFTELVQPDRLPDKLYGQSLVDGKGDAFVLNKAIPGPSDPYGGATLYFGSFDLVPNGTRCFPDARKGPVNYWISISPGLDCSPYFVVQAPNYPPSFPGRRYPALYMSDGKGNINGFYLSNTGEFTGGADFYAQAMYFTDTPTNADVSEVSVSLYRYSYAGYGGVLGTVTPGPLIFTARIPLIRSNVGTPVGPGTPIPGLGDTKCAGKAVPGKDDLWLPSEFAARPYIPTNGLGVITGNPFVLSYPYGGPYDAVFQITGSGTLYDGWYVGVNVIWHYQGIGSIRIDLCSDCSFTPKAISGDYTDANYTNSGTFSTGDVNVNVPYQMIDYVTDQNITNPSMAYTFDLMPGDPGPGWWGSPYPPTITQVDGVLHYTSDCIRAEVAFGT